MRKLINKAATTYSEEGIRTLLFKSKNYSSSKLDKAIDSARRYVLEQIYGRPTGIYVLEKDWDNLIILDACRYDAFKEVNDITGRLKKVRSRGSKTPEFLIENFRNFEAHDTIYVSSNPQIGSHKSHLDCFKLIGTWRKKKTVTDDTGYNVYTQSMIDPRRLVDRAIEAHNNYPHKRLIIHFIPPHTPYFYKDGEPISEESKYATLTAARQGEVSKDEIRSVYRENIEYVLKYVKKTICSLNGKTVVTSDHGELLGEGIPTIARIAHPRWSIKNLQNFDYGHYRYIYESELVDVPWLEIESETRRQIRKDSPTEVNDINKGGIESTLEALGYKS